MAQYVSSDWGAQQSLEIGDSSHVGEARRIATRLLGKLDFSDVETAHVALVATELATNLLKHAKQGRLILRLLQSVKQFGIEIMALDRGPGMGNVAESLRDGYSTAGSAGTGLGAVKRLAREFDIHSMPGKGTAVLARLWSGPHANAAMQFGVVALPKAGEEISGDGWGVECLQNRCTCVIADGLGHGPEAAQAAQAALLAAHEYSDKAPAEIVERAHGALRSTRGAALAVGEIDQSNQLVRFCGVGNISATIVNKAGGLRHLVSHNGIVGQETRKISEFSYPWSRQSLLIMHSDGLTARWDLQSYPALVQRNPSLIAGVLYRDFTRGSDDATVLVAGESSDSAL